MKERISTRRNSLLAYTLSATALVGCSLTIDSYLTDPSDVQCDGGRTRVDVKGYGMATFIVHGEKDDSVATLQVRHNQDGASVSVSGDVSGPPQQFEPDGFTTPTPVVTGPELSAFGAGGAWIIDVSPDSVTVQGSCDGL